MQLSTSRLPRETDKIAQVHGYVYEEKPGEIRIYLYLLSRSCVMGLHWLIQRPRAASQYVSQQEWNLDEDDVLSVRRFNALEKFKEDKFNYDHGLVKEMNGEGIKYVYMSSESTTSVNKAVIHY